MAEIKKLDFNKYKAVPVITLEEAHAIKAVGRRGQKVTHYALLNTLNALSHKDLNGSHVKAVVWMAPKRYKPTILGWRAMELAFAKVEGRW